MTVRAAVATGLLIVAAAAVSFRAVYEPDLWYHLAQGREAASGRIVRSNLFSFTHPDYRQHYTPWLFDAAVYAGWRAGSDVSAGFNPAAKTTAIAPRANHREDPAMDMATFRRSSIPAIVRCAPLRVNRLSSGRALVKIARQRLGCTP